MHGSYVTVDGRPALRFERRLAHPVEAVWAAVTEPAELEHWFPARVAVELRVGGTITFTFDAGGDSTDGEVTELDPPRRFAFTWEGDLLRFELDPEDGGSACRLRFTHVLDERDAAARNAAGWHICLENLERRLDGAPAAPSGGPNEEWRERYDEYVARGLPSGAPIPAS